MVTCIATEVSFKFPASVFLENLTTATETCIDIEERSFEILG